MIEKNTVARHASGVNAGGVRRLGRDRAEVPLSLAAMEIWHRIGDLVDDDCGFRPCPQVKVAENDAELEELAARSREMQGLGYDHEELLDRPALRSLLPAVAGHCVGGLASLGDGFAEPYRTTFAFKRKAESLGVRFLEETRALDLRERERAWWVVTSAGTVCGRHLVNCAGACRNGELPDQAPASRSDWYFPGPEGQFSHSQDPERS